MAKLYVLAWSVTDNAVDREERRRKLSYAAFRGAPAWSGSTKMVMLRSNEAPIDLVKRVGTHLRDGDFLIVFDSESNVAYYAGNFVDEDGFEALGIETTMVPLPLERAPTTDGV